VWLNRLRRVTGIKVIAILGTVTAAPNAAALKAEIGGVTARAPQ